jgi:CheY-like chemotaxis protein
MSSEATSRHTLVLVVDDSPIDRRLAGAIIERSSEWKAAYATNGVEALAAMKREKPDVVLTDLQMPEMDGLELVGEIRQQHPPIPVILMTAHGSEDIAIQALRQGAASYVPKRVLATELVPTIETVLAVVAVDQRRRRVLEHLIKSDLQFELTNDPALIPGVVLMLQESLQGMKLCDETGRIRLGIALEEALVNAMYHGNLEVSSDLRRDGDRPYLEMIERRRRLPPYKDRIVRVAAKLDRDEGIFVISDQGPGFDPSALPDPTDPANLEVTSGRGLLLIRTFMDAVSYNAEGNQITMRKCREVRK